MDSAGTEEPTMTDKHKGAGFSGALEFEAQDAPPNVVAA
jgi:hypothetical protein